VHTVFIHYGIGKFFHSITPVRRLPIAQPPIFAFASILPFCARIIPNEIAKRFFCKKITKTALSFWKKPRHFSLTKFIILKILTFVNKKRYISNEKTLKAPFFSYFFDFFYQNGLFPDEFRQKGTSFDKPRQDTLIFDKLRRKKAKIVKLRR
jgi:hypothetical protein